MPPTYEHSEASNRPVGSQAMGRGRHPDRHRSDRACHLPLALRLRSGQRYTDGPYAAAFGASAGRSARANARLRRQAWVAMKVVFVTRQGCHLCDEALRLLEELGVQT